jgi:hypothetical protein
MRLQGPRMRIVALALFSVAVATAAFADDVADCNQQQDIDLRIKGCTALTQQPKLPARDKAIALQLRGNAFRLKKQFERALADYNEALALTADDEIKKPTETGIMLVLTEAPPALRNTASGRKAIDFLEKSFQKSRAAKPSAK